MTGRVMNTTIRRDMEFGGAYQIVGTAQRLGAGTRKRIRLYDRKRGYLVREIFSNPDGSFTIDYLALINQGYIVMELDDESNDPWLDPACADRVSPEARP